MDFLEEFKKGIEEIAHSNDLEKENKELKQKLAEKEKEVERAIKFIEEQEQQITDLEVQIGKRDIILSKMERKMGRLEQKAIDELEKVKEIFGRVRWYQGSCNLGFGEAKYFDDKLVSWIDVEKEIDQQIKSLKGETDGSTN